MDCVLDSGQTWPAMSDLFQHPTRRHTGRMTNSTLNRYRAGMEEDDSKPQAPVSKGTLTAIGGTIVTGTVPLVFPAIPLEVGLALWTAAGGLFVYAGRDWIRARLPARWRKQAAARSGALVSSSDCR
jgi:hypothetical protein